LPEAIDDCVGPENPVQFIDALSKGLISQGLALPVSSRRRPDAPVDQHHSARTARQALPDDEVL
jgi:hypothetical protein